ncbi:hypothetical protein KOR42_42470 [Thalassoglobus neptunius]|uniref:Tetratricopeptide repeat protein n=1 Tax=Thalassoglobus neptunius TaxID=1938619 RepID=A0A5C5W8R4_9PLAN|nr:hypothetical protein [Thalassoglobus neptunius]TWT47050.1 hypothetical protein KOR42_42470 [Thalassoglobus neptunius]
MRQTFGFLLALGFSSTLFAQTDETSRESQLARSYYQAVENDDFEHARSLFRELRKEFPDDSLTKLVTSHWKLTINNRASSKNSVEADQQQIVRVYAVADLVIPLPPVEDARTSEMTVKNAIQLTDLIKQTISPDSWQDSQTDKRIADGIGEIRFDKSTLSLVILQTAENLDNITGLLEQLRRLQDLQVSMEARFLSIPADLAKSWPSSKIQTAKQWDSQLEALRSGTDFKSFFAPKVTLFNHQTASITSNGLTLELCGKISPDRRDVESFISIQDHGRTVDQHCETIRDGDVLVLYIGTEATEGNGMQFSGQLDRRRLQSLGVKVPDSEDRHLFLALRPRIIVQEEEEELIGSVTSSENDSKTWIAPVPKRNRIEIPEIIRSTITFPAGMNSHQEAWEINWPVEHVVPIR